MNKSLPELTDDVIIGYGKDAFINIVLMNGSCTYLKPGFSNGNGDNSQEMIFQPVAYDSLNMVTNELQIQQERIKDDKDILEKILPWIGMGILIFGMVAIAYFHGQATIKASDNFLKAAEVYKVATENNNNVLDDGKPSLGVQSTTTTTLKPPSIG